VDLGRTHPSEDQRHAVHGGTLQRCDGITNMACIMYARTYNSDQARKRHQRTWVAIACPTHEASIASEFSGHRTVRRHT
jgi:hypothetical protein